jgi:hypothetical protein
MQAYLSTPDELCMPGRLRPPVPGAYRKQFDGLQEAQYQYWDGRRWWYGRETAEETTDAYLRVHNYGVDLSLHPEPTPRPWFLAAPPAIPPAISELPPTILPSEQSPLLATEPVHDSSLPVSSKPVAVDPEYFWRSMLSCPRGVKVQLLNSGGVATYGTYDGRDPFWQGWAPLPARPPGMKL